MAEIGLRKAIHSTLSRISRRRPRSRGIPPALPDPAPGRYTSATTLQRSRQGSRSNWNFPTAGAFKSSSLALASYRSDQVARYFSVCSGKTGVTEFHTRTVGPSALEKVSFDESGEGDACKRIWNSVAISSGRQPRCSNSTRSRFAGRWDFRGTGLPTEARCHDPSAHLISRVFHPVKMSLCHWTACM
jgi:hypothetical protein